MLVCLVRSSSGRHRFSANGAVKDFFPLFLLCIVVYLKKKERGNQKKKRKREKNEGKGGKKFGQKTAQDISAKTQCSRALLRGRRSYEVLRQSYETVL